MTALDDAVGRQGCLPAERLKYMYKTLIVIENDAVESPLSMPGVINFEQYLHDYPKQNEARTRIINLCNSAAGRW